MKAFWAALLLFPPLAVMPGQVLAAAAPDSHAAQESEAAPAPSSGTFGLTVENDAFGGNTDRYYSNGLLLTWRSPADTMPDSLAWIDRGMGWLLGPGRLHWGLSLGQSLYTPEDKQRRNPDPADRPYAGRLYGALTVSRTTPSTQTIFEVQAGVVGPAAFGRQVQNSYHHLIGVKPAKGWHYQIENEPVLDLLAERRWRVSLGEWQGLETEFIPVATLSLGNANTYVAAGGTFRLGRGLDADWGSARIRPALAGSSLLEPRSEFGWYVFGGVDGRVVARDITLDGNTWRDSRSVDRRWLVGDVQGGVALLWRGIRLAYTQVLRSEEFYGQKGTEVFGSLNLSIRF
ncbi:lipid A deacylase LpxR family protein [Roseomonas chloroacetimidivorans]|uniref:lipid A deacylase LpxR family protein n=1 Tax=Roseomonas chloroacetimidivorans TaxID=1766656 RepID=UPI003C757881